MPGFSSDLPFALLFAPLGVVSGIIFSGVLVAIEGRRSFDRMSLSRFAVGGAASGLLLTAIFVVGAALRGASVWGEFLVFGPALPGPSKDAADVGLTEDEKREVLGRGN